MSLLLVLRPEPGASATVAAARLMGLEAIAAPLFTIRPIEPDLAGFDRPQALLLTSANAARMPGTWAARLAALPVYAVGEATAAAARLAGFGQVIVGSEDAAAIVARAAAAGVTRLLHLAGREHRAVTQPGVTIDRAIVYASEAVAHFSDEAEATLHRGAVALLHSPRAAALFARLLDATGRARSYTAVAALSSTVATAAGEGWRGVAVAAQPSDAALLAAAARLCEEAPLE